MSNNSITDMTALLADELTVSPALVAQHAFDFLEEAYGGTLEISDATNPFVKLLEATASQTAATMIRSENLTRRLFPRLATSYSELYPHMADSDYKDRFSEPNEDIVLNYGLALAEIREFAVFDAVSGVSKLTIPKDTVFSNGGFDFYLHWPVDIFISTAGDVTASYDLSQVSPVRMISSNVINVTSQTISGTAMIFFPVFTDQLSIVSESTQVTETSGSNITISYEDYFYYARVYTSLDDVNWTEAVVTHDGQVFDSSVITAVVTVADGYIVVKIPEIYLTNGLVNGTVRVEVLTTQGETTVDMSGYEGGTWSVVWNDFSNLTTAFSSPLASVTSSLVYSAVTYTGGSNGLTFDELRERVVYGVDEVNVPTTAEKLRLYLLDNGFGMAKQKDTITERVFIATRELTPVSKSDLNSSIGVRAVSVVVDAERGDLGHCMVITDGMPTLKPTALFLEVDGGVTLVSESDTVILESLSSELLVEELNEHGYFFTPFYYVIDNTLSVIATRVYDLASPSLGYLKSIAVNASLDYFISTSDVTVTWDEETDECSIIISTDVPGNGGVIGAVLNITDSNGTQWDMVGSRTIISTLSNTYTFVLGNVLDIDSDNNFTVTGMSNSTGETLRISLTDTVFDLVYVADGLGVSNFDGVLARVALTTDITPVTHEEVAVTFGVLMDGLYTRTREVITDPVYQTYAIDIEATYETNVFEQDATGRVLVQLDNGTFEYNQLHSEGDTVFEDDGITPVYLHRAGDYILDSVTDEGIEVSGSTVEAEVRLVLMDSAYKYADTEILTSYLENIPTEISTILTSEIEDISDVMLECTSLYYEPVSGATNALVELEEATESIVTTRLVFELVITVTKAAYESPGIRTSLTEGARDLILAYITANRSISVSDIYETLATLSPELIKNISFSSPIENSNYASLLEDNATWSLASKSVVLSNGKVDIIDDFNVSFII